jgi:hypothetical protein
MSKIKEPHYFAVDIIPTNSFVRPIRDTTRYLRLFDKGADCKYLGEASPSYLLDPRAPWLIKAFSPDAKIIAAIRDPVNAAFSFYQMLKRKGSLSCSFTDTVQDRIFRVPLDWHIQQLRLEYGFYSQSLKTYFEVFGRECIFISVFEEMRADMRDTINQIAQFLDLPAPPSSGEPEVYNMSGIPRNCFMQRILQNRSLTRFGVTLFSPPMRHKIRKILIKPASTPEMDTKAREMLVELYAEDAEKVMKLLGRELPWPNFTSCK